MDSEKLVYYRKKLRLTQKELAQLLITSVKAVSSYEQGWRKVPEHVERQVLFLISRQIIGKGTLQPCWVQKKCPLPKKINVRPGGLRPVICAGLSPAPFARE